MDHLKQIGIENFDSYDLKGRLFEREEDFIVQEIEESGDTLKIERDLNQETIGEKQDYLTFTLVKRGLSTPEAIKTLARNLHINVKRIAYNGNKDKRALTSQKISIFKFDAERLNIDSDRFFCRDISYQNNPCKIGKLYGNHFTVNVNDFDSAGVNVDKIKASVEEGIPNFYGPQRFGSSSLNIEVSKSVFAGDFKSAFHSLVLKERTESQLNSGKRNDLRNLFEPYLDGGNIDKEKTGEYLNSLPNFMYFERESLSYLLEHKNDYAGAMRLMPKYIRLMIMQSFQYYVFNKTLSELLKSKSINEIKKELPTIGYDMEISESETDQITLGILKQEGIENMEQLKLKSMPEVSLKTFLHPSFFIPENFEILQTGGNAMIKFDLKKGSYATILLLKLFGEKSIFRTYE